VLPQCLLGGSIAAGIGVLISKAMGHGSGQWGAFALFYVGGGAVLAIRIAVAKLDVRKLFGPLPSWVTLRLTVVAVAMLVLSMAGFWLLFLPLSFIAPGFVQKWGLATANMQPVVTMSAWVMQFLVAAVLAPIVEETLFRGLLLQRWATKWGTRRAVIVSSALFAVGHVELLGHFVFGLVMCALYLRTRSLWVPIATHALNNGLVTIGTLAAVLQPARPEEAMTLQTLRGQWWVGIVALVAGVVLLEWYRRRYWAGVNLRELFSRQTPYFAVPREQSNGWLSG
jgi:hypothetical protein